MIEDDPSSPCYVQTVRGKGYVFVPDADVLGGVNEGWRVAMATTGPNAD